MIPALLVALVAPVYAQVPSFEALAAEIVHGAAPSADELAAAIRTGAREERMAAIGRASGMLGGLDSTGQRVVIQALREQAESPSSPGEVRGRAFLVLGEQVLWLKNDMDRREAVSVLLDAVEAGDHDSRRGFRRHALKGLWAASGRLPQDEQLENRVAASLIAATQSADSAERVLAYNGLDDLLRSRPQVASDHRQGRFLMSSILDPIARSPHAFSTDGRREDDERWAAIKVVLTLAWATGDPSVWARVKTVMNEVSLADSNPVIRRHAGNWARSIRA